MKNWSAFKKAHSNPEGYDVLSQSILIYGKIAAEGLYICGCAVVIAC